MGWPAQSWRFRDYNPPKKSPPREKRWAPRLGCWETSLFFGDFTIDFHWFWMSSIGFQDTVDLDFLRSDYDTVRVYNRRITIDTGQIRSIFRSLNITIAQHERTMEASNSPQSEFGTHHLIWISIFQTLSSPFFFQWCIFFGGYAQGFSNHGDPSNLPKSRTITRNRGCIRHY